MILILARHGNTFEPGEKVVWAGTRNDLKLAKKGQEQARDIGFGLAKTGLSIVNVYSGPLLRARITAEGLLDAYLNVRSEKEMGERKASKSDWIAITPLLQEIDYGDWTGLSTLETIEHFGVGVVEAWEKHSTWPALGNWGGSEEQAVSEATQFLKEIEKIAGATAAKADGDSVNFSKYLGLEHDSGGKDNLNLTTTVAVSSNGKLRYFLKAIPGEWDRRALESSFKMKTGHCGVFQFNPKSGWKLLAWDLPPEGLQALFPKK